MGKNHSRYWKFIGILCFFFRISGENKQKRKRRSTVIFFSTSCKHFVRFDAFLRRFGPFWVVLSKNCHGISLKIFQKNTVPNGKTGKAKRPGATGNSRLGQQGGRRAHGLRAAWSRISDTGPPVHPSETQIWDSDLRSESQIHGIHPIWLLRLSQISDTGPQIHVCICVSDLRDSDLRSGTRIHTSETQISDTRSQIHQSETQISDIGPQIQRLRSQIPTENHIHQYMTSISDIQSVTDIDLRSGIWIDQTTDRDLIYNPQLQGGLIYLRSDLRYRFTDSQISIAPDIDSHRYTDLRWRGHQHCQHGVGGGWQENVLCSSWRAWDVRQQSCPALPPGGATRPWPQSRLISDLRYRTSGTSIRDSDLGDTWHTPDLTSETQSDLRYRASDTCMYLRLRSPSLRSQIWDSRIHTSETQISDTRSQIHQSETQISDIGPQIQRLRSQIQRIIYTNTWHRSQISNRSQISIPDLVSG